MKAVWLVSWYPNKLSPYDGDFIKRHAEATSLFEDVNVIFLKKDEKGLLTKTVLVEENQSGRLHETIIYYHVPKRFALLDKIFSATRYRRLYQQAINNYLEKNGRPGIIHVHVGMKAGLAALWLSKKIDVPIVLTEHWTGFLKEADDRFEQLPGYYQRAWKKVASAAQSISLVSDHLLKSWSSFMPGKNLRVIPNVVNTSIFNYQPTTGISKARFMHISGLDERKNPGMMLEAFKLVRNQYPDAELEIFGNTNSGVHSSTQQPGVRMNEEVPQHVLADKMRDATAVLLYSRCETFGCVIIEAQATGIPVIVSDIPVFHETVQQSENGIFARAEDPAALAEAMIQMIRQRSTFDGRAISQQAHALYSYEVVGKKISDWYQEMKGT